jgi:hypothetical protein
MDFYKDVHAYVLATLPYDPANRPAPTAKPASELFIIYLNWVNRIIPAWARTVYRSQALNNNSIVKAHAA